MKPTEYLDRKFASDKPRKCWMCSCILSRETASVDHLQPKSKGGKDKAENYRLACKPCNTKRGNKVLPKSVQQTLKGRYAPKKRDFSALAEAIKAQRKNGANSTPHDKAVAIAVIKAHEGAKE